VGNGRKDVGLKPDAVERGLERFRVVLHQRSLKMSKVRESITRMALSYRGHFSVDELVQVLHSQGINDAHLATVYRAVPLMVEAGLIQPALVSKADGQRYECGSSENLRLPRCADDPGFDERFTGLGRYGRVFFDDDLVDRVSDLHRRHARAR
jgi:hypothetical protein